MCVSKDQVRHLAGKRRLAYFSREPDSRFPDLYRTSLLAAIKIAGFIAMRGMVREYSQVDAARLRCSMSAHFADLAQIPEVR